MGYWYAVFVAAACLFIVKADVIAQTLYCKHCCRSRSTCIVARHEENHRVVYWLTEENMRYSVALVLLAAFSPAFAKPHGEQHPSSVGSMELECVPPVVLNIKLPGSKNGTLVLHLWASPPKTLEKHKPLDATAISCETSEKCETGTGIVTLNHLKLRKNASGTFSLKFGDGHKEEGSFAVVRRHQEQPFLCE